MYVNNIKIPEEIIKSLNEKKLVVFAGAGVSRSPQTGLSNFEDLTEEIAKGTGKKCSTDRFDVFLGDLKSEGIPVNELASGIILSTGKECNDMHRAIINLFANTNDIKIVTTNYDQMFEKVIAEKKQDVEIYNAPALPLGSDIEGIIHLHGNVNKPKYMVLTDDDFGSAYLSDAYASKFLVEVFKTYTVLFVGYSYNDTILRYLTRAMTQNREMVNKRFIITDNQANDWEALGITPIMFENEDYIGMQKCIAEIGKRLNRGFIDFEKLCKENSGNPPKDLMLKEEFDGCLKDYHKVQILANSIHGSDWVKYLNDQNVFDNIFLENTSLNELDELWMKWLADKIIGKEDKIFYNIFVENGSTINQEFANIIFETLRRKQKTISADTQVQYLALLEKYIENSWIISQSMKISSECGHYEMCYNLFKKYFTLNTKFSKSIFEEGMYEYKFNHNQDSYLIKDSWKDYKEGILEHNADKLVVFIKEFISNLYDKYKIMNPNGNINYPNGIDILTLEDHPADVLLYDKEDILYILSNIFGECCTVLANNSFINLKEFLIQCLQHPCKLLNNIALKSLRETKIISSCEKFDIFIENISINDIVFAEKEEVFLLVKEIFNDLTEDRRNKLIDKIEKLPYNDNDSVYKKYNWCVWIQSFCKSNARINQLKKDILSQNEFKPCPHPELYIQDLGELEIHKSPLTVNQIYELTDEELIQWLTTYEPGIIDTCSRIGLLDTFYQCVKEDFEWTQKVIQIFIKEKVSNEDSWDYLLRGVMESNYSINDLISILKILVNNIGAVANVLSLSKLLFEIVTKKEFKEIGIVENKDFCIISDEIWNHRGTVPDGFTKTIDVSINSTLGKVLQSRIQLLEYCDKSKGIPNEYKMFFKKNLLLQGKERNITLSMLALQFNFLTYYDKEWVNNHLTPFLKGADKSGFNAVWEAMAYNSSLNEKTADFLFPICIEAIEHLDWLESKDVRRHFIQIYTLLMIKIAKDPCVEYIPKFYEVAKESDRNIFINKIGTELGRMDNNKQKELWNDWIKEYLRNRYSNKPKTLTEDEKIGFISWLPELDEAYAEAVAIVCEDSMPRKVNNNFLYRLYDKKLILKYPHETVKLLTNMINQGTNFGWQLEYLKNILNEATDLQQKEKTNLDEAILKSGLNINIGK